MSTFWFDMNSRKQGSKTAHSGNASAAPKGLVIDFADLLPGDILLFRSTDQKKHQKKISAAIGSPYTHAAIYLGDNEIAEAVLAGARTRQLSDADKEGQVIGVLRSQNGFLKDRAVKLKQFVEGLIQHGPGYDWRGVATFVRRESEFLSTVLDDLRKNYGKVTPDDEFKRRPYFCSAFVVVCYIVTGVIGETAQIAYKPDVFSPASLHEDATFGWVLGYIAHDRQSIPHDDPLLGMTLWKDHQDMRWW